MAFSPRYTAAYKNQFKDPATITIERDPWTDGSETIKVVSLNFLYSPQKNAFHFTGWPLTIRVVFADDISTTTRLLGLLNAEEKEYKLKVDWGIDGVFEGWIKPSQISYTRDKAGATSVVATGGLSMLKDIPYTTTAGVKYTGRESIHDIMDRIFDRIGLDGIIGRASWMDYYSRSTGGFDTTGRDMLRHLAADNVRFSDDTVSQNPFTMEEVLLNQIAGGFDLQVWQWGSIWYAMQKNRQFDEGANTQDSFLTLPLIPGGSLSTDTFFLDIDWSNAFRLSGMTESHQQARVFSDIKFDHSTADQGVIGNASFENDIQAVGGDADMNWRPIGTGAANVVLVPGSQGTDGQQLIQIPAKLNDIAVTDPTDISLGASIEQLAGFIEGDINSGVTVKFDTQIFLGDITDFTIFEFYYWVEISIEGSSKTWDVYKDVDGIYKLSDSVPTGDERLTFYYQYVFAFSTISIPIPSLHDGTENTTGRMRIKIRGAVQDNQGQGVAEFEGTWIDNTRLVFTDVNGDEDPTARVTNCSLSTSSNQRGTTGPTVRIGSGPTAGHASKLTVLDGSFVEDGDASDFQKGDDFTGAATGFSKDRVFCDERVKLTGAPLGQLRGSIFLASRLTSSTGYKPSMYLRDQRFGRLVGSVSSGSSAFTVDFAAGDNPAGRPDAGFIPGRGLSLAGIETVTIQEIINNEDGTYLVRIDGTTSGSFTDNAAVVQTIFYMPRRLEYVFNEREVRGIWDEFYQGPAPDTFVETVVTGDVRNPTSQTLGTVIVNTVGIDGLVTVPDLATLKTLVAGGGGSVYMESFHTGLRLGGGFWIADPSDTSTPEDDGTVVIGSDGARWKRAGTEGPWRTEWFGARWDGVSSDSAAFQDLVDAAPSGKEVILPTLETILSTEVLIDGKSITWRGQNPGFVEDDGRSGFPTTASGSVIKSSSAMSQPHFRCTDTITTDEKVSSCRFIDIHFVGNNDSQNHGTATDTFAISFEGAWNATVLRCQINNFSSHGINIVNSNGSEGNVPVLITVESSWIQECSGWGIYGESMNSCYFDKNTIRENSGGGIFSNETGFGNFYSKNTIVSNAGEGMLINDFSLATIEHNLSSGNAGRGLAVGHPTLDTIGHVINGNTLFVNGYNFNLTEEQRSGLSIFNLSDCTITNNQLNDNDGYGLHIGANIKRCRIRGNGGQGNGVDFTNLRTQNPEGKYNVLEWAGLLQRDNDSSLPLQELVDLLPAGSTLFFPYGDYKFDSSLNVQKAITFEGEASSDHLANIGTYFKTNTALDNAPLRINTFGFVMRNINFLGTDQAPSTQAHGLLLESGGQALIDNCVFKDFLGSGARALGSIADVIFRDCRFLDNGQQGLQADGDRIQVIGGFSTGNFLNGIRFLGCEDSLINGHNLSGNLNGIEIQGGRNNKVQGLTSRANNKSGILFSGTGFNNSTIGCHYNGNGVDTGAGSSERSGIYISEGSRIFAHSNWSGDETGATAVQQHGIATGSALSSASILNNIGTGNVVGMYSLDSTTAGDLDIDLYEVHTVDFDNTASGSYSIKNVTFVGARTGDHVSVGLPASLADGVFIHGKVTADDSLRLMLFNQNASAQNPASGDYAVKISRRNGAIASSPPNPGTGLTLIVDLPIGNENLLSYG